MRIALAMLAMLLLGAAGARAAQAPPPSSPPPPPAVRAVRTTDPIVVDGVLSEAVWKSDNAVSQLFQSDPRQDDPVSQRTEIRVAYDDEAVYVAARLYDSRPDSIVARLARRDNTAGSDQFTVSFDTFHDRRTGYYFGVTAAGTLFDGTLLNDDWDDDSWDGVWNAQVRRDDQGWTTEMRIPFSQMRFNAGQQMVWGVNFGRFVSRSNETDRLTFTPRGKSGYVSRFSDLVGLEGVRAARKIEVTPYSTGKAEYLVHKAGDPFHDGSKYTPTAGVDLRTSLGSNLTLNATANPDFGQVEIDPAVVNLSDVETYFDEKRPFFVEGLSVFRCGNNGASDYWSFNWPEPTFFYTRRIGRAPQRRPPGSPAYSDVPLATNILGAVKVTGQPAPKWDFGTLHALTGRETADFQMASGSRGSAVVEPLTYYGILRGTRSFHKERENVGLMVMETARAFDGTGMQDALNRNGLVTALDGWTFLDASKRWVLSGWSAATNVTGTPARITSLQRNSVHYYQRPDRDDLGVDPNATSLSGYGTRLWLNKQSGQWMSNSAVGFMTPGFEANDLGFNSRGDVINGHLGLGYNWNKPNSWRKYIWVIGAVAEGWNFGGQQTMNQLFLKSSLEQINAWSWTVSGGYFLPVMNDRRTRGGPVMSEPAGWWGDLYWDTNSGRKLFYWAEVNADADESGANDVTLTPGVTWKPVSNLSFEIGPSYGVTLATAQYVRDTVDAAATRTLGGHYMFATLDQRTLSAQMRMDWSLTPGLSVQLFVQPLVSSGRYTGYKELLRPGTYDFITYGQNGSTFDPVTRYADPDGAGPEAAIRVPNRDFTVRSVRGNAVVRWEYVPGSAVYLVWTQDRSGATDEGRFNLSPSLSALSRTPANNVFMIKVAHHFEL